VFQKEWLAETMAKDCEISIHLFGKIPAELYDWRPTPTQRSVTELLQYLSVCVIAGLRAMIDPDKGWRDIYAARAAALEPQDFPAAMAEQAREIRKVVNGLAAEQLAASVPMPWGETVQVGPSILNSAKRLPSYNMQLFLYLKSNGIVLSTPNLWRGTDPAI